MCLLRIKEQVDEKRSTVGTPRYADCLLKTIPSTKELAVNPKLKHFDDQSISEKWDNANLVGEKIK